jgi:Uncharacterized protein conserved in bacteria (DUF2252)
MSYRRTLETDRRHLMEDFHYVHMARKVVGVGSVGTRAWILLMLGRDDQDPLFLQAKEAQESVLEGFVQRPPSRSGPHGAPALDLIEADSVAGGRPQSPLSVMYLVLPHPRFGGSPSIGRCGVATSGGQPVVGTGAVDLGVGEHPRLEQTRAL